MTNKWLFIGRYNVRRVTEQKKIENEKNVIKSFRVLAPTHILHYAMPCSDIFSVFCRLIKCEKFCQAGLINYGTRYFSYFLLFLVFKEKFVWITFLFSGLCFVLCVLAIKSGEVCHVTLKLFTSVNKLEKRPNFFHIWNFFV